ncbi:MAG: hypothetical protein HY964_08645 [Ignavibacteriales bacterium]|nr:hypothetical protein [Ignavibacteriales bacterium]
MLRIDFNLYFFDIQTSGKHPKLFHNLLRQVIMYKTLLYFFLLLLIFINIISAQTVSGRFSTSFYTWEKFDTVDQSNIVTRLFQNFQLDASYKQVSFHTFLNSATGSATSLSENGQIRVYNAYLQIKNLGNLFDARLGRIPVFAGVGNGVVDGLQFKSDLSGDVTFTGYAGGNVSTALRSKAFDDIKNNFFAGGQVIGRFFKGSKFSVSYMNRQRKPDSYWAIRPDSAYNPINMLIDPPARKEQLIGADASYECAGNYSLYGRFDFDLNRSDIAKAEVDGRVTLLPELVATGTFIHRVPRIFYNSFFTLFPAESVEEFEGGVEYSACDWATCIVRAAYVLYDDDQSIRYTAGFNTHYGGLRYSGTSGFAGKMQSINLDAIYPVFDNLVAPSAGIGYSSYKLEDGGGKTESALAAVAGFVVRPVNSLSVDLQGQWLRNKIIENDFRIFGKVSYWFNHNFSNP